LIKRGELKVITLDEDVLDLQLLFQGVIEYTLGAEKKTVIFDSGRQRREMARIAPLPSALRILSF
jgi:hypothetical protein